METSNRKAELPSKDFSYKRVTENICLFSDGKYRWAYEFRLLNNPTVFITVLRVMLLSFGIVFGFLILLNLIGGNFRYWDRESFASFFTGILIFLIVLLVLSAVSYVIFGAVSGWSYQVLFTMDEDGIEHRQMKKDFQRAQAFGWLASGAGLASGNLSGIGAGILASTKVASYSRFCDVKNVKPVRRRHVIYVNEKLEHNQIYAEDDDFEFVLNYILDHVPDE